MRNRTKPFPDHIQRKHNVLLNFLMVFSCGIGSIAMYFPSYLSFLSELPDISGVIAENNDILSEAMLEHQLILANCFFILAAVCIVAFSAFVLSNISEYRFSIYKNQPYLMPLAIALLVVLAWSGLESANSNIDLLERGQDFKLILIFGVPAIYGMFFGHTLTVLIHFVLPRRAIPRI